MTIPTCPTSATGPPPRAGARPTLVLLQVVVAVHLLAVLAQPVLAGLYLGGDVDAVAVHAAVGSGLAAVSMLMVVVALLHAVVVRGRWWLPVAATVLFVVEGLQIGMGYERTLELHVPLGVAIVLAAVALAVAVRR